MKSMLMAVSAVALVVGMPLSTHAENASEPLGDPVLETPTLQCLGAYWLIHGDDNRNARVEFRYRKEGDAEWKRGPDLFRVERMTSDHYLDQGGKPRPPAIKVPKGAWLFAGSIFLLQPETAYELQLQLIDPDGGEAEKTLKARTIGEPAAPKGAPQYHVIPGEGGGDGTADNPFKGISAADNAAKPGDVFLLHTGTYNGRFKLSKDGEENKPIIWRGAGDGVALIDGGDPIDKFSGSVFDLDNRHDVWFEKLSVRGAYNLFKMHGACRVVIRRCHLYDAYFHVVGVDDPRRQMGHFFISDNLIEGTMKWPTTQKEWHDFPEVRGVWLGGTGNCVCYNRIRHVKDGMDMADSERCDSNDFFNNDVSECFDDGCELDGSERNTRLFQNRFTNVMMGISFQPIYGGPAYAFRNVVYNCQHGPFKLHNIPSGAVMIHNTVVKFGTPSELQTEDPVYNAYSRNNLLIGTQGRAMGYEPKMIDCDFDYDGFGGCDGDVFIKWNGIKYKSSEEGKANAPLQRHCTLVDPKTLFLSGLQPPASNQTVFDVKIVDTRLKEGSAAVGAGEVLPGFNDGFAGKGPALGAYEFGSELPHYGPRDE
jgi:hypothetical protein